MSLPSISKIASQKLQSFSFGHRTLSSRFNTSLSTGSSKIFAQSSKSLLYKNFSSTPELVAIENYPGDLSKFTTEKKFINANPKIPTYRIMNEFGKVVDEKQLPDLDKETLVKMYTTMVKLNEMDKTLYNIQRQGRISFYMTSTGEEATHVGSAAALKPEDNIFAQYREAGVIMWRGFTIDEFMNQCYSNEKDYGKGRQMPVHYGSKALGIQTISSPLATQLPQAVGSAFAQKMSKANAITICYFGEGAASEGDAHAALNFAATLQAPVVFFCRNNRYAISTPSTEQFIGDGIGARGIAYGIDTIRVDGNDVFAVYNATVQARKMALEQNKPTLIEAMTYRIGHHSTSDDSSHYRQAAEIDLWRDQYNPITRLNRFLTDRGMWSEEKEKEFREAARKEVLDGLKKAETLKKPSIDELFNDVYDVIPPHLAEQKRQLEAHLAKYPDSYPLDHHAPSK